MNHKYIGFTAAEIADIQRLTEEGRVYGLDSSEGARFIAHDGKDVIRRGSLMRHDSPEKWVEILGPDVLLVFSGRPHTAKTADDPDRKMAELYEIASANRVYLAYTGSRIEMRPEEWQRKNLKVDASGRYPKPPHDVCAKALRDTFLWSGTPGHGPHPIRFEKYLQPPLIPKDSLRLQARAFIRLRRNKLLMEQLLSLMRDIEPAMAREHQVAADAIAVVASPNMTHYKIRAGLRGTDPKSINRGVTNESLHGTIRTLTKLWPDKTVQQVRREVTRWRKLFYYRLRERTSLFTEIRGIWLSVVEEARENLAAA